MFAPITRGLSPIQTVEALGLVGDEDGREKISRSTLHEFEERRRAFASIHFGRTDVRIGAMLDVLSSHPTLLPPRTGHLGDWSDIACCKAGALDFNSSVAKGAVGYPLIYSFNQTESLNGKGDWSYMPGSIIVDGIRKELQLFTWDGKKYGERDRSQPLFVPTVMVREQDELQPLLALHRTRHQGLTGYNFRYHATWLLSHERKLKELLLSTIEWASVQSNPGAAFSDVVSHQACIDGRVQRLPLEFDGRSFRQGSVSYGSSQEFVDAIMVALRAGSRPEQFHRAISDTPFAFPVMSVTFFFILCGLLSAHYPGQIVDRAAMTQPFNPHFHWGARSMAAYPPWQNGYFSSKNRTRSIARICNHILSEDDGIDPMLFLLLPTSIFLLCCRDIDDPDCDRISDLFMKVKKIDGSECDFVAKISAATNDWTQCARSSISPYFRSKFTGEATVERGTSSTRSTSSLREPEGFRDLTVRQACAIVGALYAISDSLQTPPTRN